LYFMIGLPSEPKEDIEGIFDLAYKVLREGQTRRQVTISISTFVPKPFTPFQWHRQITIDETREKQEFFKKHIRHKNLKLKWHDPEMSFLEGLLARGDERTSDILARVFHAGCRFDGWSDQFRFDPWRQAIEETEINVAGYLAEKNTDDPLPWDTIDCGVDKTFLAEEYEKSLGAQLTGDCRSAGCHTCGVCSEGLHMITAEKPLAVASPPKRRASFLDSVVTRLRIQFAKRGKAGLLSHLELSSSVVRAINISGFFFAFSEGFHPHPKISFPYALPVGIESLCEYADIQLRGYRGSPEEFVLRVNRCLPSGLEILNAGLIYPDTASLSNLIEGFDYKIHLPSAPTLSPGPAPAERIQAFLSADTFMVSRDRKGAAAEKDIRQMVISLTFDTEESLLSVSTRFDPSGGVKPLEILTQVVGYDEETARGTRIIKTQVRCKSAPFKNFDKSVR
ncbi:MAG: TIGR03936 family radical SAM-associated protein, partial [Syntrophales bacterium]|nr:TIGR03936 family radical SAM-associated protein [Syntrophales bacterium]